MASLITALGGCQVQRVGGEADPDQVIHDLRREKVELSGRIEQLEARAAARLAQIEQLEQQLHRGTIEGGDGAQADLPRVVTIELGRYSGPLDSDEDGRDDLIRLYVQTLDQHGRFLPVAASAHVQAVWIRADQPPISVAGLALTRPQWDDAYRSSFMGTHYRIDLPLTPDRPAGDRTVTVRLSITDESTGATLNHERAITVR